ncbi:MAG: DNA repair protein RadC [Planctomycetes bacterium]|nr:DNA repair protein RadC [Planctomycetota bacterium]
MQPATDELGALTELDLIEKISADQPCARRVREVGLARLSRWTIARVQDECGLDAIGARRLAAAFELGRRVERACAPRRARFPTPRAVWEHVIPELRGLERERFCALLLDGKHRLMRSLLVSEGTLNSSLVHPRDVFGPALREGAGALIVVHNHPSGDPEPSAEDLAITQRLHEAGELLGVPLVDHVVVADSAWVSLRERTQLAFALR